MNLLEPIPADAPCECVCACCLEGHHCDRASCVSAYDPPDVAVWVCMEHKRFLPCRTCDREPWRTIYPHSCDVQDIELVRRYQGES